MGDLAAAEDVLSTEQGRGSGMKICVLMLSGDHPAAVRKAYELFGVGHPDTQSPVQLCAAAEMLRDALATRHFDRAPLEDSVSQGLHVVWWIFDLGHTFDRLKQDDRYKTLAATVARGCASRPSWWRKCAKRTSCRADRRTSSRLIEEFSPPCRPPPCASASASLRTIRSGKSDDAGGRFVRQLRKTGKILD
jgi:hypothetical protein